MTRLFETIKVPRPVEEAFAYTSDFGNAEQWDPGVATSTRLTAGPLAVGSRFRLEVVFGPGTTVMEYRITACDPPRRVVLEGAGGSVHALDDIRFRPTRSGTRIDYTADLTLSGLAGLAEPLLGPLLERTGRLALDGLRRALSEEPAAPSPSLVTSALDYLVLPGVLRFTTLGYRTSRRCFGPLAVSLQGRTVVLTGATSGLGRAAAERLARLGARVVLVGRDRERTTRARDEIAAATGNANLGIEVADLSLLAEVRRLSGRLLRRERHIHVLINNAAVLENERRLTAEGIETSVATNLLAPFLLTRCLLPRLLDSSPSRIVNVVSGGMYLSGLGPEVFGEERTAWDRATAYARHKRALMALTETWSEELFPRGVAVNAMHPGWAETPGVARSLPLFLRVTRPFLRTPEEGADTIVWLAAAPEAARVSGLLFLDREPHPAAVLPGTAGSDEERQSLLAELTARAAQAGRARWASTRRRAPKRSVSHAGSS
jgi:NAD(P)-dependent dehydrogenase (short-subunit alcohol dehydrogenase family)/carbon monoxide dehydrogenase subunit G